MLEVAEVFADRFVIEGFAGAGGMGRVYRALDRVTGEIVALKVMTEAAGANRFAREARLLAELRHPGIVRYVAHGTASDAHQYIAMEWVEGETLTARLRRAPLGDREALDVVRRIAEAVGHAHAQGVVHRDVKPGNVILVGGDAERVKVLDFGIAHLTDAAEAVTRTGAVLGTAGYMAPEQARGLRAVDARADVFALGAVLFHCLTGRPPFAGGPAVALLAKLVLDDAPRLGSLRPELPAALDELVARMLAKEPAGRPADGAAVVRALGEIELATGDPWQREAAAPSESLTAGEQRLVAVLLVSDVAEEAASEWGSTAFESLGGSAGQPNEPPTTVESSVSGVRAPGAIVRELRQVAADFGGRLEPLRSGSLVVLFSGAVGISGGSATDLTSRAARCALAVRARLPAAPIALATGRGIVAGAFPVGEAIERAALLLPGAPGGHPGIALDSVTAGLLDARFEIDVTGREPQLLRERAQAGDTRLLLGRPTRTVGRDRELGFLSSMLDECIGEPVARVAIVVGPAGIGKSRVRWELLRRVAEREQHVEIWPVRGDPVGAGSPFGLLAQAIRRVAAIQDGEGVGASRDKLRACVERHVDASERVRVAGFLGEICRVPFPDEVDEQLASARRDPVLMGDQMRRAWEQLVVAECRAHPLLLVLEDLHWGDLPTVSYIDTALKAAKDLPLMVLALARPEVREHFPGLWEQRSAHELRLGTLTRKSAEKLVRDVLGDSAPAKTVARIVERADGNAFYLEELIRTVAEGHGEQLPETVLAMVHARLEALPDGARRVLRAASVFGGVFWLGGVAALLGEAAEPSEVSDWLALLADREMVTARSDSRFPGTPEYVFRHALVREGAYAMLTPEDRALGHRLAGLWLEDSGEPDALVLAEHFELGGLPERALAWCRTAALEAREGNDLAAALAAVGRALGFAEPAGATPSVRGELLLLEGELVYWRADHGLAQRKAEEALALLEPGSDPWFSALALLVTSAHRSGDVDTEVRSARLLLDGGWPDRPGSAALTGCTRVAIALVQIGKFELADALFRRFDVWAPSLESDHVAHARWLASLAVRALYSGRSLEYRRLSQQAAQACQVAGDFRTCIVHRHNAGHASIELGAYEEAEAELAATAEDAARFGLANVVASAQNNLAAARSALGRHDEARALLHDAIERLVKQGDRRMEGGARNHLAEALLAEGDALGAVRCAERAVEVLAAVPPLRVQALGTLARAWFAAGDLERASATAERGAAELEAIGGMADGEAQVRLIRVKTLDAGGDRTAALAELGRARQRLLERADEMDDPAVRQSFLTRVPENRETLELARAWLDATPALS